MTPAVLAALDFTGLQNEIDHPIVDIVVAFIALGMFFHARRGNHAAIMSTSAGSVVALMWLALAASGGLLALGIWAAGLVGV